MDTKTRPSLFCYSCCSDNEVQKALQLGDNTKLHVTISSWLKSELPEIKERCASIFSGKLRKNRHRGNNSAEFRYDPLSYALNFDDDHLRADDFPRRDFSSRLPVSS